MKIPSAVSDAPRIWVPADGALGVCFCLCSQAVAVHRVYMQPGVGGDLEMRLIVAGKAGGGKSATGNTLLGKRVFESKLSHQPVTVRCASTQGHWDGKDFTVVDTADIFNPEGDSSEVRQEIIRCIRLSSPGPHALLLVTQLGRFTQEDEEAAERLQDIFGADVLQHTIVIFTRAEELVGGLLQDYVKYSKNRALCELIERCGNRYCGFNNRAVGAERDHQVMELMGMVRCMVRVNGDRPSNHKRSKKKKKKKKKEKEKSMAGQIKLYLYGIEVRQVSCEPVVFNQ
uniref:AIG1-type G domain-containing protein n=1 Tax=Anas zonorhyncha TaxID=75864 RepID=A0A8B9UTK2_9AVES